MNKIEKIPGLENPLQQRLAEIVISVSAQEHFSVKYFVDDEKMAVYNKYYQFIKNTGQRCVDGRAALVESPYLGVQLPGGTLGFLDALRFVARLEEIQAREIIVDVFKAKDIKIGGHIDDKHEEITGRALDERIDGCGNQGLIAEQKLQMYKDKGITIDVADRMKWLRENGIVAVLTGSHDEKHAAINIAEGTTFDTNNAVTKGESLFNTDLVEVYQIAGYLYDSKYKANELGDFSGKKEKFQEELCRTVIKDYLQTLKGLEKEPVIYIHSQ